MRDVKEFVLEMMAKEGLNQTEFADKCGISQSTVSAITGRVYPKIKTETLIAIAKAYNVDIREFVDVPVVSETATPYLAQQEHRLIEAFRHLDPGQQESVITICEGMAMSGPRGLGGRGSGSAPDKSVLRSSG